MKIEKIFGNYIFSLYIKRVLEKIIENDKTEYDYSGKISLNREGKGPGVGKRFATPRELARYLLKEMER